MCAAFMTPIVKSNYKLYPGMPVKKRSSVTDSVNNNNLAVPGSRTRSSSIRSNLSAQSNPEFSIPAQSLSSGAQQQQQKRERNSRSLSSVNNPDDIRREKLKRILDEKERQRKISSCSEGANANSENSPHKNPFAKLLRHFGIKTGGGGKSNKGSPTEERPKGDIQQQQLPTINLQDQPVAQQQLQHLHQ